MHSASTLWGTTPARRVSQVPCPAVRTRRPTLPRGAGWLLAYVWIVSRWSDRHPYRLHRIRPVGRSHLCVSRPQPWVHLRCGSLVRAARLRRVDCSTTPLALLHVSQAVHMVSTLQLTRQGKTSW